VSRRVSRRAFIGGAAGATALAAGGSTWAILATRDSEATPVSRQPSPTAAIPASTTPSATATLPPPPPGGRQVIVAPTGFGLDTFDAQLTGKSAVVEILGRTHSRLLNWDGGHGPGLTGDLASKWETPDDTTLILHLEPTAIWHDKPPLNGRPVTAEDVVTHFRRALDLAAHGTAPLAQRYQDYQFVDSVDSPAEGQVRFRLKTRDELFLGTLAGEFALIQAPEAVDSFAGTWSKLDSDHVIGSGAWTFDWADDGVKFSAFRFGHREPHLDELYVTEPHDLAQRFIDGALDETIARDRREAAAIREKFTTTDGGASNVRDIKRDLALNRTYEYRRPEREIVMSTFNVGSPPWNNPALIEAISGALNRVELARRLFGERARPVQPVAVDGAGGKLSAERLKFEPGYGSLEGEYQPSPELRQMWDAAGGPGLGAITVDFPSVFDPLYSASSVVINMLNEALGPQFRPAVETYTTISERVIQGYYGASRSAFWFGWGPPIASPAPERYIAEMYSPRSPGQRVTRGSGFHGGDPLAIFENGFYGVVPWVRQYSEVFRKATAQGPEPSPFWQQHGDSKRSNLA
jgi:ABC-type transport system substrate-binding protein